MVLLAVAVPRLLAWAGRDELAWRWRGGALHAAWFALVVTALHVGLRLPLAFGLQVGAIVATTVIGTIALSWLRG